MVILYCSTKCTLSAAKFGEAVYGYAIVTNVLSETKSMIVIFLLYFQCPICRYVFASLK